MFVLQKLLGIALVLGLVSGFNVHRQPPCQANEYLHRGLCCRNCPAGTHVAEHCDVNHGQGQCQGCTHGQDYTSYPNGLDHCQSCITCREDQEEVRSCSPKENTLCHCRADTYCEPEDSCEQCWRCKRCSDGERVKLACNRTADTVCEMGPKLGSTSAPGTTDGPRLQKPRTLLVWMPITGALSLLLLTLAIWWGRKKRSGKKKPENGGNESQPLTYGGSSSSSTVHAEGLEPEQIPVHGPPAIKSNVRQQEVEKSVPCCMCHITTGLTGECEQPNIREEDWPVCFYTVIEAVPPSVWKRFMRTIRLKDHDIDAITRENWEWTEKCYQMLTMWRNQMGADASFATLFWALDHMNLGGCKENIVNNLKDKGVYLRADTIVK